MNELKAGLQFDIISASGCLLVIMSLIEFYFDAWKM